MKEKKWVAIRAGNSGTDPRILDRSSRSTTFERSPRPRASRRNARVTSRGGASASRYRGVSTRACTPACTKCRNVRNKTLAQPDPTGAPAQGRHDGVLWGQWTGPRRMPATSRTHAIHPGLHMHVYTYTRTGAARSSPLGLP